MQPVNRLTASRATAWHRISTCDRIQLGTSWRIVHLPPDSAASPTDAVRVARELSRVEISANGAPGGACTVAAALGLPFDAPEALANPPSPFDDSDWWFRTTFAHSVGSDAFHLIFDGLASLVDVWLNGEWLGRSDNMFMRWEADVSQLLRNDNELVLCARALTPLLKPRRPRARWRARHMPTQELRWHRTTQLGRMPGFGPQIPPVGPWRPIVLERRGPIEFAQLTVNARLHNHIPALDVVGRILDSDELYSATLTCGALSRPMQIMRSGNVCTVHGHISSATLLEWWPHTHGNPQTYAARMQLTLSEGRTVCVELGDIGFRNVAIDTANDNFAVSVNARPCFMRGVCWTPRDWARIDLAPDSMHAEFELLRSAGVNCIRLSGCFTYPTAEFLAACDRHGILVWQDLMFALLDYPDDDEAFVRLCEQEAEQFLSGVQARACILAICGNGEVAQQSAMMGVRRATVAHSLFQGRLAAVSERILPSVLYWPSTPWGGVLPFEVQKGTSHYFGVGAYKRELNDARRSNVKFTTECLAFANVPEPESLQAARPGLRNPHAAEWKSRVPRDGGVTWDFEDIRDHYVERIFEQSSVVLREVDSASYLAHGRAASAVAIERTLQEFRRVGSPCSGALMWLWADPWMGAGWGCVDSTGRPKSAWYALRAASRPVALALTNEGLNGAHLHCWNDSAATVRGNMVLRLLGPGDVETRSNPIPVEIPARSSVVYSSDDLLGKFVDIVHAYQFGAPVHDVVHAVWLRDKTSFMCAENDAESMFENQGIIAEATLFPFGDARAPADTGLRVNHIVRLNEHEAELTISCDRTTPHVRVGAPGWIAGDSYFTLTPGVTKHVRLRRAVLNGAATTGDCAIVEVESLASLGSVRALVPEQSEDALRLFDKQLIPQ